MIIYKHTCIYGVKRRCLIRLKHDSVHPSSFMPSCIDDTVNETDVLLAATPVIYIYIWSRLFLWFFSPRGNKRGIILLGSYRLLQGPVNRLQGPVNRLQGPVNRLRAPVNRLRAPVNRLQELV